MLGYASGAHVDQKSIKCTSPAFDWPWILFLQSTVSWIVKRALVRLIFSGSVLPVGHHHGVILVLSIFCGSKVCYVFIYVSGLLLLSANLALYWWNIEYSQFQSLDSSFSSPPQILRLSWEEWKLLLCGWSSPHRALWMAPAWLTQNMNGHFLTLKW